MTLILTILKELKTEELSIFQFKIDEKINPLFSRLDNLELKYDDHIKTSELQIKELQTDYIALKEEARIQFIELEKIQEKLENENKSKLILEKKVKSLEKDKDLMNEKLTKITNVINAQQSKITNLDKTERMKNLIISGVSETSDLIYNDEVATDDTNKFNLILKAIGLDEIKTENVRRVGNTDRGADERPRYIFVHFKSARERNLVKSKANDLKEIESLKNIFMKADMPKIERDEYTRLYTEKLKIEREFPSKKVEITKGKLMVDGTEVDRMKTLNLVF